jgi:hypothetical protein
MGYVEKILGDNEQEVYSTHLHWIVLLQRLIGWLFAFLVFLGLGLAVFLLPNDKDRFTVGLIVLISLVLPFFVIGRAWMRGRRGSEFLKLVWRPAVAAILILAVALVIMLYPQRTEWGWLLVAVALIPFGELLRIILDWVNERFIIINKHARDSALEKVNDVDMKQSIVGRVLGYGTVQIITGSDIGINLFHRISNPVRFKRAMLNAKEKLHTIDLPLQPFAPPVSAAADATQVPAPGGSIPAGSSIADLIEELAELHRKGILSDAEFQAKKNELLARM